jgi:hypothetical protein
MRISKSPKQTELLRTLTFDEEEGALKIEAKTSAPMSFGQALTYKLTPEEAVELARALRAYATRD